MVTSIKAIPTFYNGQRFRSRLEARWAAFFDLCEWPWVYEPEDYDGYIPDFKLQLRVPIYVEVKPVEWNGSDADLEIKDAARSKAIASGLKGEVLLLGSAVCTKQRDYALPHHYIGGMLDINMEADEVSDWCPAFAFRCEACGRRSFANEYQSWHCRVRGCHDGKLNLGFWDTTAEFREAQNLTRWDSR